MTVFNWSVTQLSEFSYSHYLTSSLENLCSLSENNSVRIQELYFKQIADIAIAKSRHINYGKGLSAIERVRSVTKG